MEKNKKKVGISEVAGGLITGIAASTLGRKLSAEYHIGELGFTGKNGIDEFLDALKKAEDATKTYMPDIVDGSGKGSERSRNILFKSKANQALADWHSDFPLILVASVVAAVAVGAIIHHLKPEPEQKPEAKINPNIEHKGSIQQKSKESIPKLVSSHG